jgi:hypothetical protein
MVISMVVCIPKLKTYDRINANKTNSVALSPRLAITNDLESWLQSDLDNEGGNDNK